MMYRLGLDIGTNSIGWCLLKLNESGRPAGIIDQGVRIFHDSRDPQSGTSLAADRRMARGARRNRDRYLKRRKKFMDALIRHDLMPPDETARKALEELNPYELRSRGLDEALTPHEFGRALFHLDQRRGFKSNRKTDADDKEATEFKQRMSELARRIEESGARTLGDYLWRRHRKGKAVRSRPNVGFYPTRTMVENEFDALWTAQMVHHPPLDETAREELRDIMFHQRTLHPKEAGSCELDPEDSRAPLALPTTHRFRMYQELNNLRIIAPGVPEQRLTLAQRDKLYAKLSRQKTLGFGAMRKQLGLEAETRFNLEDEKRKNLNGDDTGYMLANKDIFGPDWWRKDEREQDEIVEFLLDATEESDVTARARTDWGLDKSAARQLATVRLKQGYGRLGRKAITKLIPIMRDQGLGYAEAAAEAGYAHSDHRPEGLRTSLPYYGEVLSRFTAPVLGPANMEESEHGRIANPTVHVALNQLRKLTNAVIGEFGQPDEIVVELARDLKLGQKRKDELRKEQATNQRLNERIAEEFEALGEPVTGENIRRWKLWEELGDMGDRHCVYTGGVISARMLFSDEVEIDHILPFSKTLDDGVANRTLSLRRANRDKGSRSPHDAFHNNPKGYEYAAIVERAEKLPRNKRWRFGPDAMERFEKDEGFIARQLTDTAYATRLAREYLTHVCPANQVWAVPGRLTTLLRGKWKLNSLLGDANLKNRVDHRHHAIDATVAAVTDRGLLQRVARAAEDARDRLVSDIPEPWEGFRDELRNRLDRVVVSHKADHGAQGRLHEATAYGLVRNPDKEDGYNVVYRKSFPDLNANEVERIRDKTLRARVRDWLYEAKGTGLTHKQAMAACAEEMGIRHIRLLKKEAGVVPIEDRSGDPYKAYSPGDNHRTDIWELPGGRWIGTTITVFEANRATVGGVDDRPHPAARRIMRLHKGDLVKMEHEGAERIMRVVKLNPSSDRIYVCGASESGDLQKRHNSADDPFRWAMISYNKLKERRTRKVRVDVLGQVYDPGFSR